MWCDSCFSRLRPESLLLGKVGPPPQKKKKGMAFDMHSSHNLIASFSKQSLWAQAWRLTPAKSFSELMSRQGCSLKSSSLTYTPRLITTIPSNSKHLSFLEAPSSFSFSFPKKQEALSSHPFSKKKGGHPLFKKKKKLLKELSEEAMVAGYLMTARLSSLSGMWGLEEH